MKQMKAITKIIGDLIKGIIGKDNNRFFAILLFIALMFALWIVYQQGGHQNPASAVRLNQQIKSAFK
jgi:hypothetical protein